LIVGSDTTKRRGDRDAVGYSS